MSWYTGIYVFVRKYRKQNPIRGYLLHLCLNTIVFFQVVFMSYSFYVYTFEFCFGGLVTNHFRIAIYLLVFYVLFFMLIWSFVQVLRTPISRVPAQYHTDNRTDRKIRKMSSYDCREDRYYQECASTKQAIKQRRILDEFAEKRRLKFAEVFTTKDRLLRYCYDCKLVKPDRAHHCRACGFCVLRYDHHCPILNTCIGVDNYKYFLLYVTYGCLITAWSILTQLEGVVSYVIDGFCDKRNWILYLPSFGLIVLALMFQVAVLYYPLIMLFCDHFYHSVIKDNETTCESRSSPIIHPDSNGAATYNLGCWKNVYYIFGWGLWWVPLNTLTADGLHYEIAYPSYYLGPRLVLTKIPENDLEECIEVVVK